MLYIKLCQKLKGNTLIKYFDLVQWLATHFGGKPELPSLGLRWVNARIQLLSPLLPGHRVGKAPCHLSIEWAKVPIAETP